MIDARNDDCIDISPCLECPNHKAGINKTKCISKCEPLKAYQAGKPYKDLPYPEIPNPEIPIDERRIDVMEDSTRDYGPPPTYKKCMVEGCGKKVLNRGLCSGHYQKWRKGKVEHPTLGKFVPSQVHIKSKIKTPKKPKPPQPKKPNTQPPVKNPDIVTLDFSRYPDLKAVIFEGAGGFLLPVEHMIISILAGAITRKREK